MSSPDVAFRALQRRLHPLPAHESRAHPDQTIVVLPSFDVDLHILERHVRTQPAYEERFLYLLFLLGRDDIRIVFTSSLPVEAEVVDYYLGLLPPAVSESARERLTFISPDDPSPRPLATKLLEHPELVAELRGRVPDPERAFIVPFNVGDRERDLALALDLPIYGPAPALGRFGTKSGSRKLFAASGVPLPRGREQVGDLDGLTDAVVAIRVASPGARGRRREAQRPRLRGGQPHRLARRCARARRAGQSETRSPRACARCRPTTSPTSPRTPASSRS